MTSCPVVCSFPLARKHIFLDPAQPVLESWAGTGVTHGKRGGYTIDCKLQVPKAAQEVGGSVLGRLLQTCRVTSRERREGGGLVCQKKKFEGLLQCLSFGIEITALNFLLLGWNMNSES